MFFSPISHVFTIFIYLFLLTIFVYMVRAALSINKYKQITHDIHASIQMVLEAFVIDLTTDIVLAFTYSFSLTCGRKSLLGSEMGR